MVKDYGKICASSKSGKIFYGKNNTILWKDCELVRPSPRIVYFPYSIYVDWPQHGTGVYLASCSFWTNNKGPLAGLNWSEQAHYGSDLPIANVNGHKVWWEYEMDAIYRDIIHIDCDSKNVIDTFECHLRYWSRTTTYTEGTTMSISDVFGKGITKTVFPAGTGGESLMAFPDDPGFIVRFKKSGELDSVDLI